MLRRPRIGELLLVDGLIDRDQLATALEEQKRLGSPLAATLVQLGFIEESDLVQALARQLKLPVARLEGKSVEGDVLELIPRELAEKYSCVPLFIKEDGGARTLYVGMEFPSDLAAVDDLSFRAGMKIQPVLVAPSELHEAIDRYYRRGTDDAGADADALSKRLFAGTHKPPSLVGGDVAPDGSSAAADATRSDLPVADVLRALSELLIDREIVSREELLQRIQAARNARTGSS